MCALLCLSLSVSDWVFKGGMEEARPLSVTRETTCMSWLLVDTQTEIEENQESARILACVKSLELRLLFPNESTAFGLS